MAKMSGEEWRQRLDAAEAQGPEALAAAKAELLQALMARPATRTLSFGKAPAGGWTDADRVA